MRGTSRTIALAAGLLLALEVGGAQAAPARPPSVQEEEPDRTTRYLTLIARYRAGERRAAAEHLVDWSFADVEAALGGWHERLSSPGAGEGPRRADPTPPALAATAMIAHLHAAARLHGLQAIEAQIDLGLLVADFAGQADLWATDERAVSTFLGRWHVAGATIWLGSMQLPQAEQHLDRALALAPGDPVVLLAWGSLQEAYAAIGGRSIVVAPESDRAGDRWTPAAHIHAAAESFEAALSRDPDLGEARVRYARTLLLLDRAGPATVQIARAGTLPLSPVLEYHRLLVAGAIAEARGRLTEAADHYRAARERCGGCQSPTLALSQVLLRTGDRHAAIELVEGVLGEAARTPPDPWWVYHRGQWPEVEEMLADLEEAVPQ